MDQKKFSIADTDSAIYAIPMNLNFFLENQATPDAIGGVTQEVSNVPKHPRRRYVNDPTPHDVEAHSRTYMVDPGRTDGAALPGKPFRVVGGETASTKAENRQFRYTGDWKDIYDFFVANTKYDIKLYSSTGGRHEISTDLDNG